MMILDMIKQTSTLHESGNATTAPPCASSPTNLNHQSIIEARRQTNLLGISLKLK